MNIKHALIAMFLLLAPPVAGAQVTSERIVKAADEPQNWLTYSGGYSSQRYSPLKQIDAANVKNLEIKWMLPNQVFGAWQSSPLVVDGIMYLTMRPNDVMAVDAKSGRVFWQYRYQNSPDQRVCCGVEQSRRRDPRRHAVHGDARRAPRGDRREDRHGRCWNVAVGDPKLGYSITLAPLVVKDKVIVGVGGGEYRHPRIHRRARSEDRQGIVAF